MKKLFAAAALLILTLSGCQAVGPESQSPNPSSSSSQTQVAEGRTLIVHYQRFAEDYEPWNLWLWPAGMDGAAYPFTETDDFGVVARVNLPTAKEDVGIIVRTDSWDKDVAEDRFITEFDATSTAEIWLVQGDPTIYYSLPDTAPSIMGALVDDFKTISLTLNKKITLGEGANGFSVAGPNGQLAVVEAKPRYKNPETLEVILKLDAPLQLGTSYQVTHPDYRQAETTLGAVMGTEAFERQFHYEGSDLGNSYTKAATAFRVWAPTASEAMLVVYQSAESAEFEEIAMSRAIKGTWTASLKGDQHGTVYNYRVKVGGRWQEAVDPYVRASTINSKRGVVVDLSRTNGPLAGDKAPTFSGRPTDAVFYELHVRDLAMDSSSGIPAANRGKFLGLIERGTKTPDGKGLTGLDAILDLGVTHLQLLPIYDYGSVDESNPNQFNWGYDPVNYNVPEGSYSTKPRDPVNRIIELKTAVRGLHDAGLGVVMDVVYNHVYDAGSHSFERLVPGYFFRKDALGKLANGTGVGNEVASERSMARKYIIESATYWAKEYRLDGFRFDLMGILDTKTMNEISSRVRKINPNFLIIGEGWNMGQQLPAAKKANQLNAFKMPAIAHFNDGIRDGIKGSVFDATDRGFASGAFERTSAVKAGIVGQTAYSGSIGGEWGRIAPGQSVSYVEAHDNLTLFDKLKASLPKADAQEISRVFALSSSIAILAQGIPFIHAGQEFMRSKGGDENSYKSPDSTNALRWNLRQENSTTVAYFKGLLEIRAAHPAFRMRTAEQVKSNLKFLKSPEGSIAYRLNGKAVGDSWRDIVVIHNAQTTDLEFFLPEAAGWKVAAAEMTAKNGALRLLGSVSKVSVPKQSTMILYRD